MPHDLSLASGTRRDGSRRRLLIVDGTPLDELLDVDERFDVAVGIDHRFASLDVPALTLLFDPSDRDRAVLAHRAAVQPDPTVVRFDRFTLDASTLPLYGLEIPRTRWAALVVVATDYAVLPFTCEPAWRQVVDDLGHFGAPLQIVPGDGFLSVATELDPTTNETISVFEFDPSLYTDAQLSEMSIPHRNGYSSAVLLAGRIDAATSMRLLRSGWCFFDGFGNAETDYGDTGRQTRVPDPTPDPRPGEMLESLLVAELDERLPSIRRFWTDEPTRPGVVDDSCFSQWYVAPFEIDGRTYRSAEHWMMAEKARLFGDRRAEAAVMTADHPAEAKAHGQRVRWFSQPWWDGSSFEIVLRGTEAKFRQHPELGAHLLATGESVLAEASPRDRRWGIGLAGSDERSLRPSEWLGTNHLGFALMTVRQLLSE